MFYQKMTNDEILTHLNNLVEEWRGQFENPPEETPIRFHIIENGMICVNGTVLFFADKLNLDSLSFEAESLFLSSIDGEEYEIGLNWRLTGPPYLSFVKKTSILFAAP